MGSLNRIVLLGEVSTQPDTKATTNGGAVCNFTLEVARPPRQDGMQSAPDRIKIVCWQDNADQAATLGVGTTVLIEGQIHNRTYDDQSGTRHYVTEVEARGLCVVNANDNVLSPSSPSNSSDQSTPAVAENEPAIEVGQAPKKSFDFAGDSKTDSMGEPPEFGEPVEEDIPF